MNTSLVDTQLKTAAAGPYLGYALQPVRFCLQLLQVEDGVGVSIEYLDDVALHGAGGALTLEQCKSFSGERGLTDKSIELWKTFANWADICTAQSLDPTATSFVLAVVPGKASQLVHRLQAATSDASALAILTQIKKWQTPAAAERGAGPHISRFLAHGDEACGAIIKNFSFVPVPDPVEAIRRVLRATLPEAAVDDFTKAVIGMADQEAQKLMRAHAPPIVDATTFRSRFHAFVRKHNLAGLLNSTTGAPDKSEIDRTIKSAPMFVRQLAAIEATPDLVVGAVAACLRSTADRVQWAEAGEIVESSLDDFDHGLERKFALVRDSIEDMHSGSNEKARGRLLYRQCALVDLPLESRTVPSYFVEGAYNILADDVRIGWHPSYKALLGIG